MATSLDDLAGFLDEYDLKYHVDRERSAILIAFTTSSDAGAYRTPEGEATVRLVIRLTEDGEFLSVFSPNAWNIDGCPHQAAVFEAIPAIQSQYKMLRFDHDPVDGELRPNIELPLEDAVPTSSQFHRMIHGLLDGIQRFDRVIRHAMETGEVSFACLEPEQPSSPPTEEVLRLMDLAGQAGGIDELERLVGVDGLEEDEGDGRDGSDEAGGQVDEAA